MAAGDRKIKITSIEIARANPVTYAARWQLWVETKIGADVMVESGTHLGSFGTPAAWRAMTGAQMETAVTNAVTADINVPARDSVA